jgi:hypothetical protein
VPAAPTGEYSRYSCGLLCCVDCERGGLCLAWWTHLVSSVVRESAVGGGCKRRLGLVAAIVGCVCFASVAIHALPGGHASASDGSAAAELKQDAQALDGPRCLDARLHHRRRGGPARRGGGRRSSVEKPGRHRAGRRKFFGDAAGQQLTKLLKEHITIAVDLIKAAKGGDKAAQQKADALWQQNAVQIAEFLSKANPKNWPRDTLVDMMKTHLSTTTNEVVARLNKNWAEDVRAYDAVYDHILKMSDALADGIVKQFPDKFAS